MILIKLLFLLVTHDIWGTYVFPQVLPSLIPGSLSQRGNFFDSKIIGGLPAKTGDFPYQLSLHRHGNHYCGASFIQVEDTFLAGTAAHCVNNRFHLDTYVLVAGDVNSCDTSGHEQTRKVVEIVVHEDYGVYHQKGTFNDIALLFLDEPFYLGKSVSPIPLPDTDQETEGLLIVSGYKILRSGEDLVDILQYVKMPVVSQTICQTKWKNHPCYFLDIGDDILCARVDDGETSHCYGDGGSPAISNTGGYLAGIVSFGDPTCGHPRYPDGFTKVSFFVKWIHEQVLLIAVKE